MKRGPNRILTTHAGRLVRPPELRQLLAEGTADANATDTAIRSAVAEVVKQQAEVGIDIAGDGDLANTTMAGYLAERFGGFEFRTDAPQDVFVSREQLDFPEFFTRAYPDIHHSSQTATCIGAVTWVGSEAIKRDMQTVAAAREKVGAAEFFMTAPSPATVVGSQRNAFYPNQEECEVAIADALRLEYSAIVEAGYLLQVELRWTGTRSRLSHDVELLNYGLGSIEAERVRVLLSFGQDEGPHNHDPELRDIIDVVLKASPRGLCVVSANGRHEADCDLWSEVKLPDGKVLIPGVIDSSTNIIEHPKTVAERILRMANLVGRENVIAGVDAGFEPAAGLYQEFRVTRDVMWAKLRSLVEGADLASSKLWG